MKHLTLTLVLITAGCSLSAAPEPTDAHALASPTRPVAEDHVPVVEVVEPAESVVASPVHVEVDGSEPPSTMVSTEPGPPPPARYTLRRGETLAHFARWAEQPVEEIAESSALDLDGTYAVGTELALRLTDEERSVVEARRDAHHQLRARNYLASRRSTVTEFYPVRTGDSAWVIARERLGMPVWMLESLNPSVDLDRLRPGQELLVPVFQDIVVEAEAEVLEESDRIDEPLLPVE